MNTNDLILLQEALKNDTIRAEVSETIQSMKKEKVISVHRYEITPPKDSNSRGQTYIKMEDGKRKKVSAFTEKSLYEKLYDVYFNQNSITMKSLYPQWIEKRISENVCIRTIRRNENHWEKYYAKHKVITIPVEKLNVEQIELFFHETIRKYNLTVKELNNMKFIFTDIMKMAKRRKFIADNPFNEISINTNSCRPIGKQTDTSRVYLPDEKEKLFQDINHELINNPDNSDAYAILLLFKLALRIGEVVALKWSDIDFENKSIHIHRMETLAENENGSLSPTIAEYTKKKSPYGDRILPLGDYELMLFQYVMDINKEYGYSDQDFIFCDEQGRTKIREIDNRIRKLCNKADIEVKSAHDIRRTVASELFNNGVPVEIIRNYLGHSDIKTTWGYILDNHRKEETAKMIIKSLENLNGLKRTQAS